LPFDLKFGAQGETY